MSRSGKRARVSHADAGFSLLEIVIALALLSLILATLPSLVQMSRKASVSAAAVEQVATETVVESFIVERISAALPLRQKLEDGELRIAFQGTPQAIRFVAPVADGPMGTGLFELELSASEAAPGGTGLFLRWQPFTPQRRTEASSERVLLPDLDTFSLRYFGLLAATGQREWSPTWSERQELPEMVEVSLARGGKRQQTRLVAIMSRTVP